MAYISDLIDNVFEDAIFSIEHSFNLQKYSFPIVNIKNLSLCKL